MLKGEYSHILDAKGRLIVPNKLRDDLGEHFVITKGMDNCLFVYPLAEWKKFEEKLLALPITNVNARKFVRFFVAGAVDCDADNQGRVMIPQNLREYANLKKDIVSVGQLSRVEIWNKDSWIEYNDEENYVINELTEDMAQFGI